MRRFVIRWRGGRTDLERENAELRNRLMWSGVLITYYRAAAEFRQRPMPHPVPRYRWRHWRRADERTEIIR